jgi:GNAT superfamily N-acetyltransferase
MMIVVRDAVPDDAESGSLVLRRSITELCVADHKHDPEFLGGWLRNKTPDHFRSWIKQPANSLLVVVGDSTILAVGSVTDAGEITLNYVSPDARFSGISKALLLALEERATSRGCTICTLLSSETARRFYLSNGYVEVGHPAGQETLRGCPMMKNLKSTTP